MQGLEKLCWFNFLLHHLVWFHLWLWKDGIHSPFWGKRITYRVSKSIFDLWSSWRLVDHAWIHFLLSKVPATPQVVHVLEVHHLEGVLIGTGSAHHCRDLTENQGLTNLISSLNHVCVARPDPCPEEPLTWAHCWASRPSRLLGRHPRPGGWS